MPTYEFRCALGHTEARRRSFANMDAPTDCSTCGQRSERQFTPTQNVHIPLRFKAVRANGVEGGYSWSDFHSHTEKELAHLKELNGAPVEIVPAREWDSRSRGDGRKARQAEIEAGVERAYDRAARQLNTIETRS